MRLDEASAGRISETIREVEIKTDAEVVTVLAPMADNYYYIPTLWASLLALLTPYVLTFTPFWLEPSDLTLAQVLVFVVLALTLRLRVLLQFLIPKSVRYWRASNLARRQFLEQKLHRTEASLGVLIFLSELERYVEILVVQSFTSLVRAGRVEEGFITSIQRVGEVLSEACPPTREKNELPNHLIQLG
jgi:putative membrane protein